MHVDPSHASSDGAIGYHDDIAGVIARTNTAKLGAAALFLSGATSLSGVLGLVRAIFIASTFGAAGTTDAFYAAFTIPDFLNYGSPEVPSRSLSFRYRARLDIDNPDLWR